MQVLWDKLGAILDAMLKLELWYSKENCICFCFFFMSTHQLELYDSDVNFKRLDTGNYVHPMTTNDLEVPRTTIFDKLYLQWVEMFNTIFIYDQ